MVCSKWNICLVFALAIALAVECVDPNDRRHMSNRNAVVSKSRSMPGKWTSQNAVMSNVGAMFPGYSHGLIASPLTSNSTPSRVQRSSRSRRSTLTRLLRYHPYFNKHFGRHQRRTMRHSHHNSFPFLPHIPRHAWRDARRFGKVFGKFIF